MLTLPRQERLPPFDHEDDYDVLHTCMHAHVCRCEKELMLSNAPHTFMEGKKGKTRAKTQPLYRVSTANCINNQVKCKV